MKPPERRTDKASERDPLTPWLGQAFIYPRSRQALTENPGKGDGMVGFSSGSLIDCRADVTRL